MIANMQEVLVTAACITDNPELGIRLFFFVLKTLVEGTIDRETKDQIHSNILTNNESFGSRNFGLDILQHPNFLTVWAVQRHLNE